MQSTLGSGPIPNVSESAVEVANKAEWFAIHTRPRHERKVAALLNGQHINAFVPTFRESHTWSDRRKVVEVPLFSCYVFLQSAEWREIYYRVARTPGVFRWVSCKEEPSVIPNVQMEAVRSVLSNGLDVSPYPFLKLGQRVRIRGGCMDGLEGILTRKDDVSRLVVSIEMIQRSVSVVLRGFDLEPV